MNSITEFLHMGGYGAYVWSAYGITSIAMVLAIIIPLRQHTSILQRLSRQLRRKKQS